MSKGVRSIFPFVLIHSDVCTCLVLSVNGMKYFVVLIDCHLRMTWVYLLKHKMKYFSVSKKIMHLFRLNLM